MTAVFLTAMKLSVITGAVALAVLALSPFLERRCGARWKYYIWIALALRMAVPFELRLPTQKLLIPVPSGAGVPITIGGGGAGAAARPLDTMTVLDAAAMVWLLGCLVFLAAHIFSYLHYKRRILKTAAPAEDAETLRLIRELSQELGLRRQVRAVKCCYTGTPMLLGFWRPVLVLPETGLEQEALYFVLKHELVHARRHDVCFKLLFVAANAVHWFNPLAYVVRRQAAVDMELSCDERVVLGSDYAVRKAYTYTLLSTLRRQYNKGSALTTEFYGGTKIMKKRFLNILGRGGKRGGALFLACVLCLTAALSLVTGCSQAKPEPPQPTALTPADDPESFGHAALADSGQMVAVVTPAPVDDSEEISRVVADFAEAYLSDDVQALKALLTDPFEDEIYTHNSSSQWTDLKLKGLPEPGELELGTEIVVSLEHRDSDFEDDMLLYMTIKLIKQSDGWKISSYLLEA